MFIGSNPPKRLRYAGIGPQATPNDVLEIINNIGCQMHQSGWHLSSGWGAGADQAFAYGHDVYTQTQWVPWVGFRGSNDHAPFKVISNTSRMLEVASEYHPYWGNMKNPTKLLMARNVAILMGDRMDMEVDLLIYWQSEKGESSFQSGTNHTRRVANVYGIPSFNIRLMEDQQKLIDLINRKESK